MQPALAQAPVWEGANSWHELVPTLLNDYFSRHAPGAGAEIGVWRGELSERLLVRCPALTHLLMVDPWEVVHVQTPDGTWKVCAPGTTHDEMRAAYDTACAVAERADGRATVLRRPSVAASQTVSDGSLAVVIVDGLHFVDQVTDDIQAWLPKLRTDGLMVGDDMSEYFPGVEQAVRALFGHRFSRIGQTWWLMPQRGGV